MIFEEVSKFLVFSNLVFEVFSKYFSWNCSPSYNSEKVFQQKCTLKFFRGVKETGRVGEKKRQNDSHFTLAEMWVTPSD